MLYLIFNDAVFLKMWEIFIALSILLNMSGKASEIGLFKLILTFRFFIPTFWSFDNQDGENRPASKLKVS